MECTGIFWHHFYKGAGVMLGAVLLAIFRQQRVSEEEREWRRRYREARRRLGLPEEEPHR